MKKLHYLVAMSIVTLTLAGCSNEEVISSPEAIPQAISFKGMANKTSRTDVTSTNITRFRVFGCNTDAGALTNHVITFNDVTVTRAEGATSWTYSPVQYWAPNKDYYFVALSTNSESPVWTYDPSTGTDHTEVLNVAGFKGYGTVNMDITKEGINAGRDLVYSYNARTTGPAINDASSVDFTFQHMLSRVAFTFVNGFPAGSKYDISISNITVGGLVPTGSCKLGTGVLNWVNTSETNRVSINVPVQSNNLLEPGQTVNTTPSNKFIIPCNQTLSISFNVTVKIDNQNYSTRTLQGNIAATDFQPGQSYMFTATVTADNIVEGGAQPIEFTASVSDWPVDNKGEINITNPSTTGE